MVAPRSIASLSLSFGLVTIPVRLYSATNTSSDIKFNLLSPDGSRLEQQYVSKATGQKVERDTMVKGYEFETGQYVVFTKEELKAIEESPSHVVEILGFVPDKSIDRSTTTRRTSSRQTNAEASHTPCCRKPFS
ncbi:Ku protein [Paraburkholderia youngii]